MLLTNLLEVARHVLTSSFGLAGLARRWLVYPAALIWPSSLASTVLFRALHEPQDHTPVNGWTVTRYKYFVLLAAGAFVLFWIPDYLWTTTSAFAFATWIAPNNQKVNTIFGMNSGLGLIPLSIGKSYAGTSVAGAFADYCRLDTDQLRRLPADHSFLGDVQCLCGHCHLLPVSQSYTVLLECVAFCPVSTPFIR